MQGRRTYAQLTLFKASSRHYHAYPIKAWVKSIEKIKIARKLEAI